MDLADSVENIKGIGPKTAALLQKADIKTIRDLLYLLPRDYEVYQNVTNIKDLRPGKVTVKAKVSDIKTSRKRRLTITEAQLSDETGALRAIWFNQPYRANQFSKDQEYLFAGNLEFSYGRYQITNPSAKIAADNKKANDLRIVRFSTQLLFSEPQVVIHEDHMDPAGMVRITGDQELAADRIR